MHNELIHLGEVFRQRRKERNLGLKEVENATSIRVNYLEAIEEGHMGKLISPIYAQGFIKKYAAFLELDGETILKEHPYVMKILSEKPADKPDFTLGIGSLEIRGTPAGEVKWLPNVLWVGGSVVLILVGWFLARYFGVF
jgi:cytoskeletal protein RodZ